MCLQVGECTWAVLEGRGVMRACWEVAGVCGREYEGVARVYSDALR